MPVDEESKGKLEEALALAKENNKMLIKIRRVQRRAAFSKAVYWILILAIMLGAYIYIQPYVQRIITTYQDVTNTFNKVKDTGDSLNSLPGIFESFKIKS